MKHFLILGEPEDLHAAYVAWALETGGYATTFVNSGHSSCPTETTLYLDSLIDQFTSAAWENAAAAWCRRLSRIPVFNRGNNEDDEFILGQEGLYTKWVIQMAENHVPRWVNSPTAAQAAENKLVQLKAARYHGIAVPRTLITSDPTRFRSFLEQEKTLVAKPIKPFSWSDENDGLFATFATLIDCDSGADLADEDIAQCVTIYQQRIDKVSDVRMVIMGDDVCAFRISQTGEQYLDVRVGFCHEDHLAYEPITVPPPLKRRIDAFMRSMKVNFASADFALTDDGEFVFLDLNPSGQWLFIESSLPESGLGQRFCSFFVHGSLKPDLRESFPSFSEYQQSEAGKSLAQTLRDHPAAQAQPSQSLTSTTISPCLV